MEIGEMGLRLILAVSRRDENTRVMVPARRLIVVVVFGNCGTHGIKFQQSISSSPLWSGREVYSLQSSTVAHNLACNMSRPDPEAVALTAEDFEFTDDPTEDQRPLPSNQHGTTTTSSRSPYHLPASEQLRGVANRIIFSRYYIFYY